MPNRVNLENLRRSRGYALILAFVVSTLVETLVHWRAPPDVIWMAIMAVSLYLLFEAGLLVARLLPKR